LRADTKGLVANGLDRERALDDVQHLTGTIADALRTIGLELTSLRLLLQFGLILLAAIVGTLAA